MPRFRAHELTAGDTLHEAAYAVEAAGDGWRVLREGRPYLDVGPGHRLLRVSHCGVCATDLARAHLPFPLPQICGHEVVALDEDDRTVVVEINDSHAARGLPDAEQCGHCRLGLDRHCPERLVVGIDRLPGGFGSWLLAPVCAVVPVPGAMDPLTATLAEPFAAAWHAVTGLRPAAGERVAVLGAGRLGTLVVAALAAWRRRHGGPDTILVVTRSPAQATALRALGADEVWDVARTGDDLADVVIDTTGDPDGLATALRLATREVHLKSTTGQASCGIRHPTALVVDELTVVPAGSTSSLGTMVSAVAGGANPVVVALASPNADLRALPGDVRRGDDARALQAELARDTRVPLGAADAVVVSSAASLDAAIRPSASSERGLVRPRGSIIVAPEASTASPLLAALLGKGLRLSSSRCGDLRDALPVLAETADLGSRFVTARVPASELSVAWAIARRRSGKVVVTHPDGLL
jgi:threonine dehydrogenase-like Zn-dependent dehydrogenase